MTITIDDLELKEMLRRLRILRAAGYHCSKCGGLCELRGRRIGYWDNGIPQWEILATCRKALLPIFSRHTWQKYVDGNDWEPRLIPMPGEALPEIYKHLITEKKIRISNNLQ